MYIRIQIWNMSKHIQLHNPIFNSCMYAITQLHIQYEMYICTYAKVIPRIGILAYLEFN